MKTIGILSVFALCASGFAFGEETVSVNFTKVESEGIRALIADGAEAEMLMNLLPDSERAADGSIETSGTIRCNRTAQIGVGIQTECTLVTK